jgi:hypothetical protein
MVSTKPHSETLEIAGAISANRVKGQKRNGLNETAQRNAQAGGTPAIAKKPNGLNETTQRNARTRAREFWR